VIFDVVRRYLKWLGYDVRYVQNFTDIDDKILKRALAENSTMEQIAEKYIAAYFEDADRLNILRADAYPRATHAIDGIQRLIHELEQQPVRLCCRWRCLLRGAPVCRLWQVVGTQARGDAGWS
jgi:cysteinyl-tRNA synthetase